MKPEQNKPEQNKPEQNKPEQNLSDKLFKGEAVRSLEEEREVIKTLRDLGWGTAHSVYYEDQREKKWRELDVVARRSWSRKRKAGAQHSTVNLMVECKSLKGYHVVFAPETLGQYYAGSQSYWLPEGDSQERLETGLDGTGLNNQQLSSILREIEARAFPKGEALLSDLQALPPDTDVASAAFRETNTDKDKELENSVLWRANQSLRSALKSFQTMQFTDDIATLRSIIRRTMQKKEDPVKGVMPMAVRMIREMSTFHPVIVIEAQLWAMQEAHLHEVPWCRHVHVSRLGIADWWVDVVSRANFSKYAASLTNFYDQQMHGIGAHHLKAPAKPLFG